MRDAIRSEGAALTRNQAAFIEEMRQLGADSPATALAEAALPRHTRQQLRSLLAIGAISEGAPGMYYASDLSGPGPRAAPTWRESKRKRALVATVFWAAVVLLPILLLNVMT